MLSESKITPKKIVILGAGYGGAYTFKYLSKQFCSRLGLEQVSMTLVSKTNYFVSTPFLHEVATGSISPEHIIEPLRKVLDCKHEQLIVADVMNISLTKKEVITKNNQIINFDYLVLALGSETNYRGVSGAEQFSFPLKTLDDAIKLKNRFLEVFEKATNILDKSAREKLLNFVVVGGGATGVELVAEMADLFYETFAKYYEASLLREARITLVHAGDELLVNFSRNTRIKSKEVLRDKGINVKFGLQVTEVTKDSITLNNGERIESSNVIWTAGVRPSSVVIDEKLDREAGRILVNQYLQVPNFPNVYALGDMASFHNPDDPLSVPMLAQVAHKQAEGVARNIIQAIQNKGPYTYIYKHSGDLVSLGEWVAAGEFWGTRMFGHIAWFLWRGLYLSKLLSWSKRLSVLVDWLIDVFIPRDISEIYTKEIKMPHLESETPSHR